MPDNKDECTCMLHFERDSNPEKLKLVIEIQDDFVVKSISDSTGPILITLNRKRISSGIVGTLNPSKNSKIYCAYFDLTKATTQDVAVYHDYQHPESDHKDHHKPLHRPIDPR